MFQHICGISTLMKGTGASSGIHLDLDKDGIIDTRIQIVNFTEFVLKLILNFENLI